MEVNGKLHSPPALSLGKVPQYVLNRRLGGIQSHFGHFGEEKNLLPVLGIEHRPSHP